MNAKVIPFKLGQSATITKSIKEEDIITFAKITGDYNPLHVDKKIAKNSIFKSRVAHGLLTASLISATLGMKLPGPGTIYLSQSIEFKKPVKIGDSVTAKVEIIEIMNRKESKPPIIKLRTYCINQNNEIVLEGEAVVMKTDLE